MSFPITCTACHKTFTISDEIYGKKVSGRVVTIKCKSCGQGIRVDGLKGPGASAPAPVPAGASPAAAAPPSEALWAVDYPDGEDREFTTAEVLAEIGREAVVGTTLVWREGMAEWLEVHQVPELASELVKVEAKKKAAEAALAAAAAAAAAKAAPIHKPRAPMPTVTGLAGLPVGGFRPRPAQAPAAAPAPAAAELPKPRAVQPSAPELPKPRAAQPSAPELPKPRAAQPSAPELLKPRAAQPSAPELLKPRAQQPSAPDLPKPQAPAPPPPPPLARPVPSEASGPALQALFAPEPTPPLPASVAQAFLRPQTPAAFPSAGASPLPLAAFGASPAVVADAGVEWPQPKSKAPLIIGIVVALAAVAGGVLLLGGKQDAPPATTPITALPPTPAAPPAPTAPGTAAEAAAHVETAAAAEGSDTATGSDPVAAAPDPGATPGAGFAELFAAGARKAESKGATMAPTGRFDAAATKAPLAEAANQAQACKQSGGPSGKVTVVVTFDPNGKASSATITDPPFAGTGTGACITSALKRASVPPFSGLPGTVSKTFSIL